MSFKIAKNSLIYELFVRTADENYITARWCYVNNLRLDFSWLAVHCLEKYLKAVLLMNGQSAKEDGHDIRALYKKVHLIASDLLPEFLTKPPGLRLDWREWCICGFLEHIYKQGKAENRYLTYGYDTRSQDLFMLDQLVFAVRRLIRCLDEKHAPDHVPYPMTNRELLSKGVWWRIDSTLPIENQIYKCERRNEEKKTERAIALLNHNYYFLVNNFPSHTIRVGSSSRNPIIQRAIFDRLNSANLETVKEAIESAKWLLGNVVIPGGNSEKKPKYLAAEILDAIGKAELRLNKTPIIEN